ncbi:hypothetical protein H1R20_g1745, partial [Candolleomyces eurysporus]
MPHKFLSYCVLWSSASMAFTSILLHGLACFDEGPHPVALERVQSFPPLFLRGDYDPKGPKLDPTGDLSPHPIPYAGTSGFQLELEARVEIESQPQYPPTEEGRTGWVFPLEVTKVTATSTCPSTASSEFDAIFAPGYTSQPTASDTVIATGTLKTKLPPLCIKVVKPTYSCNVAREAWMYEWLDDNNMTGAIAPGCYGLFHTLLPSADDTKDPFTLEFPCYPSIPGWIDDRCEKFEEHPEGAAYTSYPLYETSPAWTDDPSASYATSRWRTFTESWNTPSLTVLLLEKVGKPMTLDDYNFDKDEVRAVFEDALSLRVNHGDLRLQNILRVPEDLDSTLKVCQRHQRKHRWFLVDWEMAAVAISPRNDFGLLGWLVFTDEIKDEVERKRRNKQAYNRMTAKDT